MKASNKVIKNNEVDRRGHIAGVSSIDMNMNVAVKKRKRKRRRKRKKRRAEPLLAIEKTTAPLIMHMLIRDKGALSLVHKYVAYKGPGKYDLQKLLEGRGSWTYMDVTYMDVARC